MRVGPILMSGPMVAAMLDDKKTQTRRIVKPSIVENIEFMAGRVDDKPPTSEDLGLRYGTWIIDDGSGKEQGPEWCIYCAEYPDEGIVPIGQGYGTVGDLLWVRETWYCDHIDVQRGPYKEVPKARELMYYRATDCDGSGQCYTGFAGETMDVQWKPSIHMPQWASRITLELTDVRIERLQEISHADCIAEGCDMKTGHPVSDEIDSCVLYHVLWDSLNEKRGYGWDKNPWVWVLGFKVHKINIDEFLEQREAAK